MLVRSLVLLSFLSTGVAAQQVDTTVTKAAVMAADRALADRVAKDGPQAFLAALDQGAAVLFPGQPILRGRVGSERPFLRGTRVRHRSRGVRFTQSSAQMADLPAQSDSHDS